jgi:hypothetical protein
MQRPAFIVAQVKGGINEDKDLPAYSSASPSPPRTPYFVWMNTRHKTVRQPEHIDAIFMICNGCNEARGPHYSTCTNCGVDPFGFVDTMASSDTRFGVVHDAHTTVKATVSVQITGLVEGVDYAGQNHGKTRSVSSLNYME